MEGNMKTLQYSITIRASQEKVWNIMLDAEQYKEWAKAFSPDSQFEGEWQQGTYMTFIDPTMGGTKALLEEVTPFDRIHAKHVAIIRKDGSEDTESDVAKNWMGITETYILNEENGITELSLEITTHEDYENMFNDGWPHALELLKGLCETRD
jgi:uncharacterized protein YndB with AHSA1/START domain